jgi:DNA-binding NtrC family response regulator
MLCLIVDDDPGIRDFVRAILRTEGFETIEANGGAAALEMVRKLHGSVELIITDIQMPGGDGRVLARHVAAMFPGVRVILMSGYEGCADPDFIAKPFSWEEMRGLVRRVLARAA